MKINQLSLMTFVLYLFLQSCSSKVAPSYTLIPAPQQVGQVGQENFNLNSETKILYIKGNESSKQNAFFLSEWIQEITQLSLQVEPLVVDLEINAIAFRRDESVKKEGFNLNVTKKNIVISSSDEAGAFYAMQLIRKTMLAQQSEKQATLFPVITINDYPSSSYRGAMLDVSRNFFTIEQVKRYIDLLALHHLNYFHWHLTDDQGWRIEIKQYPELTRIGAWSGEGTYKRGGYYTQEEIEEVVTYAAQRHITIIPEIDLPGHISSALAAYPQLGCTGGPYQVATTSGGVYHDVLCLGNESTMQFTKDVLKEVVQLFPAPYVHIGGDEVPRNRWQTCSKCQACIAKNKLRDTGKRTAEDLLQGWFNIQMSDYLKLYNKQMIGWDEILSGDIALETVVMTWRGFGHGAEAVRRGNPVILSSNSHFYFNNYQSIDMENEPEATGGLVMMQRVYDAPIPLADLSVAEQQKIMGAEVCLWSSYIFDNKDSDYMMLPRLAAFSELMWTGKKRAGYRDFLERLPSLLNCYQRLGYHYAPHFFEINATYQPNMEQRSLSITLKSMEGADIYYTIDGTEPSLKSTKYTASIQLSESGSLRARAYLPNGIQSDLLTKEVVVNKATFAPITMLSTVSERYQGNGGKVLVDGVRSDKFHTTGLWVGCNTDDIVVVIDLKSVQTVKEVSVSSLTDLSSWIMGPASIEILLSDDGKQYSHAAVKAYEPADGKSEGKLAAISVLPLDDSKGRYVKVIVKRFDHLPANHTGAGQSPYLFVDEISIN